MRITMVKREAGYRDVYIEPDRKDKLPVYAVKNVAPRMAKAEVAAWRANKPSKDV